jgi:ArsR family transcriptional regulator, lead/cadmium/zinc/bismuth-responsive transcriptional repressor
VVILVVIVPKTPTCQQTHQVEEDAISEETSEIKAVRTETLDRIQTQVIDLEKVQRMAEFFSLLGDTNRLRILSILAKQELCVCDLATVLKMSESAVSHQLRTLRSLRLVGYNKIGRKVYYRLLDRHVFDLYNSVAEHLDET